MWSFIPLLVGFLHREPINISLFYEADCPGCQAFILGQLDTDFFRKALKNKDVSIELLPYGNAQDWNQCQHGLPECKRNMLEACVINYEPEQINHLPLIICMEQIFHDKQDDTTIVEALNTCSQGSTFKKNVVRCYGNGEGEEGRALIEVIKRKTTKHDFVPWVQINGVHDEANNEKILGDLQEYLCERKPSIAGCQARVDAVEHTRSAAGVAAGFLPKVCPLEVSFEAQHEEKPLEDTLLA